MSSFSCSATICTMNDRLSKAEDRRSRFPPALSPLGEEGLLYISSPRNHTLSPGMDSERQLVPALPESKSFQNLAGQDTLTSFWERDLITYVYRSFLEMQIPYQERKMILEFHHSFMFHKRLPLQLQIFPACSLYSLIFPVFLSLYFFPFLLSRLRAIHHCHAFCCSISEFLFCAILVELGKHCMITNSLLSSPKCLMQA